jgi:GNAT superfamily N-acetyltransferase
MTSTHHDTIAAPLRIRVATPEDARALTAFMTDCFRETYVSLCAAEDIDAYVAGAFLEPRQRAELQDPSMRTLLIEERDAWAGYAQLKWGEPAPSVRGRPAVELARFYVDRPWQGRGVAQVLMRAALEAAAAEGARVAWLGVWQRNPRAVRFYEKAGFRVVGTQGFTMGRDVQQDHVMARGIA